MYDYISGKLVYKCATYVVIDAGGIGYSINISLYTYGALGTGEHCKLYIYTHIKEDAHTLYGFLTEQERRLFMHLISVSGIGAGTGRMMLSSMTPDEIQLAIMQGNHAQIQRIKGIGAKGAQRLVLELQDKLKKEGTESLMAMPVNNTVKDEALTALVMLGFVKNSAEKVLDKLLKDSAEMPGVEQLIKAALKSL